MEYVLATHALGKKYGRVQALENADMHVPKGSIYGFVGKNGAGKTTLLRLVCNLQKPTSGTYTLFGKRNTDPAVRLERRRMGAIIEQPAVCDHMTVIGNLQEQCRIQGIPDSADLHELAATVGLADQRRTVARRLSLGMKQRLGIAMALIANPDFLILDEPTNGLDPQGIVEIRELLLRLNRENQVTIVVASHILDELSRIATNYGFIDRGRIIREISARELEDACRKCVRLRVTNAPAAARGLDEIGAEYRVLSDSEIEVYGERTITEISNALFKEDSTILTAENRGEDLAAYYLGLVGGGADHV